MIPFLKLPIDSYKRIWQSIRSDGLILNGSGKDYQMASNWLAFVSKYKHDHKKAVDRWKDHDPLCGCDICMCGNGFTL